MYRLKTMNSIAREGLDLLGKKFSVSSEEADPQGLLVRSSRVNTNEYPSLLAVARAGAGVNNISVSKATERGVCVFNTPGANANAVVDLVFPMIGVWQRNIYRGIKFCESLQEIGADQVSGEVEQRKSAFKGVEIAGKTLAVIGLGQIRGSASGARSSPSRSSDAREARAPGTCAASSAWRSRVSPPSHRCRST